MYCSLYIWKKCFLGQMGCFAAVPAVATGKIHNASRHIASPLSSSCYSSMGKKKKPLYDHWLLVVAPPPLLISRVAMVVRMGTFSTADCVHFRSISGAVHRSPLRSRGSPFDLSCCVILITSPPPTQRNVVPLYRSVHGRTQTRTLNHQPCVSNNRSRLAGTLQLFVSTCKSSPPLHR